MLFFRLVLIVVGSLTSFFIGGHLTQDIVGALGFAVIALFLLIFVTKPLKKKKRQTPSPLARASEIPITKPGKRLVTVGRVVWSIITVIGVSGVIAFFTYVEEQKDRERDRRDWSERQYQERENRLREQMSSSISGRVFDRQSNAPLGNAVIGYMSNQGFVELSRTAPDGSFHINMPFLTEDYYPVRIAVIAPMSGGVIHYTNEYIQHAQKRQNVNIYVFNQRY